MVTAALSRKPQASIIPAVLEYLSTRTQDANDVTIEMPRPEVLLHDHYNKLSTRRNEMLIVTRYKAAK